MFTDADRAALSVLCVDVRVLNERMKSLEELVCKKPPPPLCVWRVHFTDGSEILVEATHYVVAERAIVFKINDDLVGTLCGVQYVVRDVSVVGPVK